MNTVDPPRVSHDKSAAVNVSRLIDEFRDFPANIQVYDFVVQMAVLSIADAFVTHCGMNSASEGLCFKVPLVLTPQIPEQMTVAKRTEEL